MTNNNNNNKITEGKLFSLFIKNPKKHFLFENLPWEVLKSSVWSWSQQNHWAIKGVRPLIKLIKVCFMMQQFSYAELFGQSVTGQGDQPQPEKHKGKELFLLTEKK